PIAADAGSVAFGDDTESAIPPAAVIPEEGAIVAAEVPSPAVEEPIAPPAPPPSTAADEGAAAPLVADQEAALETVPPEPMYYGDYDSGTTSRLPSEEGAAASVEEGTALLETPHAAKDLDRTGAEERDDFHEAPTGGFAVPPLPPMPAADVPEDLADDELSGATRILSRPRLVEVENGAIGREHALALGRTSIGRASDNLVHLLDEAVSRHHAEVVPGPRGYLLRDLSSENGIFVNGERAPEHVLRDGDVIQIGARTLVFHGA
ncbi:MAG TPA: FHA domain-containing protein, partial [Thermoanaerobaculia bacterium]|nr:FHA domain-containing protein [Thermoanaerobaculia bacterium]